MVSQDHILKSIRKYGRIRPNKESPMTRPFDDHDGPAGITPQHGFLTPAIRRDVADLNHQFLTLALEPALSRDDRFAVPDEVRRTLEAGGESLLVRAAAGPLTLFPVSRAPRRPSGS